MTVIKRIFQTLAGGQTLSIGKPEARAISMYVRNRKMRNSRSVIDAFIDRLSENEHPLTPEFLASSHLWLRTLCYDKQGRWRDTEDTRRFGVRDREVLNDFHTIVLAGVYVGNVQTYFSRSHPGHEPAENVYPLWRVLSHSHGRFDYIYVPWQNHQDRTQTGFSIF